MLSIIFVQLPKMSVDWQILVTGIRLYKSQFTGSQVVSFIQMIGGVDRAVLIGTAQGCRNTQNCKLTLKKECIMNSVLLFSHLGARFSVSVMTRLFSAGSRVRFPPWARDFFFFLNILTGCGDHPDSYSVHTGGKVAWH